MQVKQTDNTVIFNVHVQPRASKTGIGGIYQNALKIRLTAPPVGGAANKQCIDLLAKALGRPKSTISITAGHTHRIKQLQVGSRESPLNETQRREVEKKLLQLAQSRK
jgi:uncharacterized protein (TIGR00251 family)